MTDPLVLTLIAVAGGLVGALLTALAGGYFQDVAFIRDNKKAEYRTLLDSLTAAVEKIQETKNYLIVPGTPQLDPNDWTTGMTQAQAQRVYRHQQIVSTLIQADHVIDSRLFIQDKLKEYAIKEDWRKIEVLAHRPRADEAPIGPAAQFDGLVFALAWGVLMQKIMRVAEEDVAAPRWSQMLDRIKSWLQPE